jgi:hypothetical protein
MNASIELLKNLESAVQRLTDRNPDQCGVRNDSGWSARDMNIGASLAFHSGRWSPGQSVAAWKICSTYRATQLSDLDIPPYPGDEKAAEILEVVVETREAQRSATLLDHPDLGLKFSAPRSVTAAGKPKIVRSASPSADFWALWKTHRDALKARGFSVGQYNGLWQVSHWAEDTTVKPAAPVVQVSTGEYTLAPLRDESKLLPFQIPAVSRNVAAMRLCGASLDASDTGVGKTYIALGTVRELGLKKVLVVSPKAVRPSWTRVAAFMGVEIEVVNWELVRRGGTKWCHKSESPTGRKQFTWDTSLVGAIIFDEIHRAKKHNSQNGTMVIAARRQKIPAMGLSATAGVTPLDFKAIGYMLGLFDLKDFWTWVQKYGCRPGYFGGYEFAGDIHDLLRLHKLIFPSHGNRTRIDELGDAFPKNSIHAQFVPVADPKALDEAWAEINEALESVPGAEPDEHHLTTILRARQKVELLKIPALIELARDSIESGNRVVIFVNFTASLEAIVAALKKEGYGVGSVYGTNSEGVSQTAAERQHHIDRFQDNKDEGIVLNADAGREGIGLHDLQGGFPRESFISPPWSPRVLKQELGRIARVEGKTACVQHVIYADGTVEVPVGENLERNLDRLDTLNDGDLRPRTTVTVK